MNKYEYKGNIRKGRCSKVAKQAFADIKADKDCFKRNVNGIYIPIVLTEEISYVDDSY